jgi:hypothetical protein
MSMSLPVGVEAGHVDGIERAVDLNVLRGGADALKALAGG